MYYNQENRENMRFMLIFSISLVLHIFLIIFLPFLDVMLPSRDTIKDEKIRAGLISFIDETEQKLSNTPVEKARVEEQVVLEESKKVEEVQEERQEIQEPVVEVVEPIVLEPVTSTEIVEVSTEREVEEVRVIPQLTGPTRTDRTIESTRVSTTTNQDALRERPQMREASLNIDIDEGRSVRGAETLEIPREARELRSSEVNLTSGSSENIKLGKDTIESRSVLNVKEDFQVAINIRGDNNETKLPQNISSIHTDVVGGIVDFRRYREPIYPQAALERAQSGSVEVEFNVVGVSTRFMGVTTKSGFIAIDRAVEEAAREWVLEIRKDGLLANGRVLVRVEFGLRARN